MRRWLLVAGLLLLVGGLTVAPAAAVVPSRAEPAAVTGPDGARPAQIFEGTVTLTITPRGPTAAVCTTAEFTVDVGGPASPTGTLTVTASRGSQVELTASQVTTTALRVTPTPAFPTFTAAYEQSEDGVDTITATWREGESTRAETSIRQTWTKDPVTGDATVELTQSSDRSQAGTELLLEVRVGNGSRCGGLKILVNGVRQEGVEKVDDTLYRLRHTREDRGTDHIEAVWRQPRADPVTHAVDHRWTPKPPEVAIVTDSEQSPRGTALRIQVTVVDAVEGGALALAVTGANPRTLTPTQVENTFRADYIGTEPGRDTITATWTQDETPPVIATAVHNWGEAQPLDLTAEPAVADLGAPVTLTAHFTPSQVSDDVVRARVPLQVKFLVSGANPQEHVVDLAGNVAQWTYEGRGIAGPTDTVQAFLLVGEGTGIPSNTVTVTWRTPTVTLTQDSTTATVGQQHVVTATVTGVVAGSVTFSVAGPNAGAQQEPGGTHPTFTLSYRGAAEGRDTVTATFVLGGARFTSAPVTVDWGLVHVVVNQATAVSQVDHDLVLTASLSPAQARGAVVFTAAGAGDRVTLRDDTADGGFTVTLRRSIEGVDAITATWEDAGATATSEEIRHEWRPEPVPTLVVAPGGATTCIDNPFDLTVIARTGDTVVPDLPVQLTVARDGAPSRRLDGVTAATGVVPLRDTGGTAGADTLTAAATIGGVAVTSAPATHTWQDCALDVAVDPGGPTSTVGSPVSPVVTVRDPAGRPVPDAAVTLRITMTGQDDVTADLITDANGLATTQYRRDVPGTDRITAVVTAGERRATATAEHVWQLGDLQVSVGPAGASSVAGSPFTLTVLVTAGNKPVPRADVGLFVIMSGQDDLGGAPGRTDDNGTFSYTYTRPVAGDDTVDVLVAAGGQVGRASTRHHWTLAPVLRLALEPGGTAGEVGTDFTATATVTVDGGPRAAADVVFVAGPPNRPGRPRTITTDGSGRAAFTYRGTEAGTDTITATVTLPGFPQGSASINRVWRAAGVVRQPDRRADVRVVPRTSSTPTPTVSPAPTVSPGPTVSPTPGGPAPDPQGPAVVEGTQCPPDSTVTLTVGGVPLGTVTADAAGNFALPVRMPDLAVGRHQLVASCPPVRVERDVDIVRRTSSTGTGAASASTAVAVLSFFVLLGGQLVRWRSGS